MKRLAGRIVLASLALGLLMGCSSPTTPRFPSEQEEDPDTDQGTGDQSLLDGARLTTRLA